MTKKEFNNALKRDLIRYENDRIISTSMRSNRNTGSKQIVFTTTQYKEIEFDIGKFDDFVDVIYHDKSKGYNSYYYLYNVIDKYIRLIIYDTPDEEMHQLADEHEIVGVMNIVDDTMLLF